MTWDKIPTELLEDCAQLTKANSIEGMPNGDSALVIALFCKREDSNKSMQETKKTT